MDEQKIIFSNRFEKEKFEDYKTDWETDSSITPDFTEADDFLKFIQKNRRSVPSKERIADKDKFIKTVYELSNSFEIDADLIEFAEGYTANIYVDYACYTGYIKKLLAILFILADDISFLDGSKEDADMLFSFTYHTHHIFLNNKKQPISHNVPDGYSTEQPSFRFSRHRLEFLICRDTVSIDIAASDCVLSLLAGVA